MVAQFNIFQLNTLEEIRQPAAELDLYPDRTTVFGTVATAVHSGFLSSRISPTLRLTGVPIQKVVETLREMGLSEEKEE